MLACLAALLGVRSAWAHPQILGIEPPPGAQLREPPPSVAITFNEPLEALSTLALYDSHSILVAQGGGRDPAAPARLLLRLPTLAPSLYTAVWTAAGSDGHVVRGNFAFSVLGPTATVGPTVEGATPLPASPPIRAPSAVAAPDAAPFPLAQSVVRWALLLGATGAIGGWVFWRWVALPSLGLAVAPLAAMVRWRRWSSGLLLLVLLGSPLLLALYVYTLTGRLDAPSLQAGVSTRQGVFMLARMGLTTALFVLVATTRDGTAIRRRTPLALCLGALLLLTFALAGHAGAIAQPLLPVAVSWLHLAATSVWVGGLLLFALNLGSLPGAHASNERLALLGALLRRFSPLALGSVIVLTISGLIAAFRELPAPAALWQSTYGQTLSLKLLLFGAMLACGAYHLLIVRPGVMSGSSARWPRRFRRSLWLEGGLGLLVLALAGALTSLAPPTRAELAALAAPEPTPTARIVPTITPGPTRTPVPSRPFDQLLPAGDLQVRLAVSPASLGENRFQVHVTAPTGQPVAPQLVRLTFTMLTMDMGQSVLEADALDGVFTVTGNPLSMVGDWQVVVLVRRAGAEDVTAVFRVPVGERTP